MYMRLWRRICNDPRFGRTCHTDLEIRTYLRVPSIDCLIRRRRLIYLSRMLRSDVVSLQALLQCRDKNDALLPWATIVIQDFSVLTKALPRIFQEMSDPDISPDTLCRIARDQPREWKNIVGRYVQFYDDIHSSQAENVGTSTGHTCDRCARSFATLKALLAHQRKKHGDTCAVNNYIGDVSICPMCLTDFHSRVRLITHLSDTRVRSKARRTSCNAMFLASKPPLVEQDVLERCTARDRCVRAQARKTGHTHEIAAIPCVRKRALAVDGTPTLMQQRMQKRRRLNKKTAPEALFRVTVR